MAVRKPINHRRTMHTGVACLKVDMFNNVLSETLYNVSIGFTKCKCLTCDDFPKKSSAHGNENLFSVYVLLISLVSILMQESQMAFDHRMLLFFHSQS